MYVFLKSSKTHPLHLLSIILNVIVFSAIYWHTYALK
jgi:hypothetical protein